MSETVKDTPPLTDEQLRVIEGNASDCYDCGALASDTERLVVEVRRLRSDEWLEKAAREMLEYADGADPSPAAVEAVLAILRKHRG